MGFRKSTRVLIIIVAIVFGLLVVRFISPLMQHNANTQSSKVKIGSTIIDVEVADTSLKRAKGLMNRTSLESTRGMLFVFETEGIYPFWMKNTLIPLDIIWIDSNKKIVSILENVPICPKTTVNCSTYSPYVAARFVLEVNAGVVKQVGATVGDVVGFL